MSHVTKHPERPVNLSTLYVELPDDLATAAHEAEQASPGFLMRTLAYGVMRRGVFNYLREREAEKPEGGANG